MKTMSKKQLMSITVCMTLLTVSLPAQSNQNIVHTTMKLRGDVEEIYSKIDENKDNSKSQIKSLVMQKADTEAQINRKKTALQLLESDINTTKEKLLQTKSNSGSMKPMLSKALLNLEQLIETSLPFKKEERLTDVRKIKMDMNQGNITEEKALALTWASYDDALRLTKEIGLFKQQITVAGEEKMAKIAKLGSVMMFFSTPDNHVGYVVEEGGKQLFKVEKDEKTFKE